jgi:hypothetical protein
MKIAKWLFEIFFFILVFQTCAFGQPRVEEALDSNNRRDAEEIVQTAYAEYSLYLEAWQKGQLNDFDKAELEKRYNKFAEDIELLYHMPQRQEPTPEKPNVKSPSRPARRSQT